jgi:hypothetical protein
LPPTDQGLLPPADNATGQQQDGSLGLAPQLPPPQATEDNVNDGSAGGDLQSQQGDESGLTEETEQETEGGES